jgi:hypothetical protein
MALTLGEGVAASTTGLMARLSSLEGVSEGLEELRALCACGKVDDIPNVSSPSKFGRSLLPTITCHDSLYL